LAQVQLVLPVLGVDVLRPVATRDRAALATRDDSPKFVMEDVGAIAHATEINGQFVVLKGSTARIKAADSWDNNYKAMREQLISEKKLVRKDNEYYEFTEDVEFNAPTPAAVVVAGGIRNGRTSWRLEQDRQVTYAKWKESQLVNATKG
jgi:hypothetical protein